MARPGRKRGPMSPEYQEVVSLYTAGVRPAQIATQLRRERSWVNSAVQRLRSLGAIGPDERAPTGRTPGARPAAERRRLLVALDPDLARAIDRARGDLSPEAWAAAVLRKAAGA